MDLDVRTLMQLGVLLSLLTVVVLAQAGRGFPGERHRHLNQWTVGLLLQPLGWLLMAGGELLPAGLGQITGQGLILLGLATMVRATRGFLGLPERAWAGLAVVAAAVLLQAVFTYAAPGYSHRVVVNAGAAMVLLLGIVLALRQAKAAGGFGAARLTAGFAAVGVVVAAWRFAEHLAHPVAEGSLLRAGPSELAVALYACIGLVFLSLGFVLMHTERAYRELRELASVDVLTGVTARSGLEEHAVRLLAEARRHGRRLSAILMDLDQFKAVNDSLGHEAGDQLLKHLAERARHVLRGEDVLVRLGGDEFVALLPGTDAEGACVVAERLREALRNRHLVFRGQEVPVTLSIGVAEAATDASALDAVLQRADAAMYQAKHAGGDSVRVATGV